MIEVGESLIMVWGLSHLFGHMESLATGRHSLYNNAQCPGIDTTVLGGEAGRDLLCPLKHGRRKEGEGSLTFYYRLFSTACTFCVQKKYNFI